MNLIELDTDELLALAFNDMKKENFEGALEKAKRILVKEETPNQVYSFLGRLYATLGLFSRAKESFELFIKLEPGANLELFQLGMVEKDMGNFDQAIHIWERVIEENPQNEEAKYFLGDLLIKLQRIDEARSVLLNLLETAEDESEYIPLADQLLNRLKGQH